MMKVSIQGIQGAFHEEAARLYFNPEIEIVPNLTFQELMQSVQNKTADYGIVAIENTISGTIHANLNLIRHSDLQITGEVYLSISQNLIALPNTNLQSITEIHSHYMAINQCREYLEQFKNIKILESEDTALSIKNIAVNQLRNVAAIGSNLAAKQYNLEIIASNIETNSKNYTRFLILSKQVDLCQPFDKALLALTLPHKKGSLSIILSIISFYDINLTKIESFPIIGEPWHYLFYLDVVFESVENYKKMVSAIKQLAGHIEILGEYISGNQSSNQKHKN
mgnify:CR=1 FL=1